MAQSSQFSAAKVLEAAQQAEAGGNRDYAVQFYRHISEQHPQSPEVASAQEGLARLLGPPAISVGEQLSSVSEPSEVTQPAGRRGSANQSGARGASSSHNQTQAPVAPGAAVAPVSLQSQSVQSQSVQSQGAEAPLPHPHGQNGEAAAANLVSTGPASNGTHRQNNTAVVNGAGAGPLSSNGGAANGASAAPVGPNLNANNGAAQFGGTAVTPNGAARPQSIPGPALGHPPGSAPTHPEQPLGHSQSNPAKSNLAQSKPPQTIPPQAKSATSAVLAGKDNYRIGRGVTYILGFLGWLILLASIGMTGAAIFAPGVIPGLAPRGPGFTALLPILFNGAVAMFGSLVIISFAQLLRAVFDNANANRELVALQRAAAR